MDDYKKKSHSLKIRELYMGSVKHLPYVHTVTWHKALAIAVLVLIEEPSDCFLT